ncbi:MAG TPA: C13 family peptidase [Burkholderiales bacterium]|nr:C13 family peptidase [Burkholderiales bacterium]
MKLLAMLLLWAACAWAQETPIAVSPDGGRYYGALREGKFNGRGRLEWDNGARYEGGFENGLYHGRGRLTTADGRAYSGEFEKGQFHGRGRYEAPSGEVWEGDFEKGELTGHGTYSRPDGMRYRGEFVKWRFHGEGTLTHADGSKQAGQWQYGRLLNDPAAREAGRSVETALFAQRQLLDAALAGIAPGRRGIIDLYLLAVAGDGTQEVFRREVEYVRSQFDGRYGTRGRSIALVNSRHTYGTAPMATVSSLQEALKAIAARMDRDEDILFLFLTSHGTAEHELKLQQNHMALRDLPARELAELLKASGIRWKVIVVSACYSGGFIDAVKDDSTLVITAARHDRTSFGCADENDFTYFGKAFFKDALPGSRSFEEAFRKAEALLAAREKKELPKEQPSAPQMHSGAGIAQHLKRWWNSVPGT